MKLYEREKGKRGWSFCFNLEPHSGRGWKRDTKYDKVTMSDYAPALDSDKLFLSFDLFHPLCLPLFRKLLSYLTSKGDWKQVLSETFTQKWNWNLSARFQIEKHNNYGLLSFSLSLPFHLVFHIDDTSFFPFDAFKSLINHTRLVSTINLSPQNAVCCRGEA